MQGGGTGTGRPAAAALVGCVWPTAPLASSSGGSQTSGCRAVSSPELVFSSPEPPSLPRCGEWLYL